MVPACCLLPLPALRWPQNPPVPCACLLTPAGHLRLAQGASGCSDPEHRQGEAQGAQTRLAGMLDEHTACVPSAR